MSKLTITPISDRTIKAREAVAKAEADLERSGGAGRLGNWGLPQSRVDQATRARRRLHKARTALETSQAADLAATEVIDLDTPTDDIPDASPTPTLLAERLIAVARAAAATK